MAPLMLACLEGHGGVVDVQLSNGVDIDQLNEVSYSYMFLCMCIVYRTTMSIVTTQLFTHLSLGHHTFSMY